MEPFVMGISTFIDTYKPLIWIVAVACLVICGVMVMTPSERSKNKGKEHLPWVFLGIGIVLCATNIVHDITAAWGF
ncbi:MAG: hypothetical protein ACLU7V_01075 [Anaerovoracaceae bacterium]|nr:hypothetical protein [Anaerovoracaceae bacterium]